MTPLTPALLQRIKQQQLQRKTKSTQTAASDSTAEASEHKLHFTFDFSDRYRAYGGSSYGCSLPNGEVGVENAWSWLWQTTPQSVLAKSLGAEGKAGVNGDGTLYQGYIGVLYWGYIVVMWGMVWC